MKRLVNRKWLLTHALVVVLVALFLLLGWWQLQRAEAGNTRSWAYMLEWPSFALLVIGFWMKIMYDELHPKAAAKNAAAESKLARTPEELELAVYNRYIADVATRRKGH